MTTYALFATDGKDWFFAGFDEHLKCIDQRVEIVQDKIGLGPDSTVVIAMPEPKNAKMMAAVSSLENVDWDAAFADLHKE